MVFSRWETLRRALGKRIRGLRQQGGNTGEEQRVVSGWLKDAESWRAFRKPLGWFSLENAPRPEIIAKALELSGVPDRQPSDILCCCCIEADVEKLFIAVRDINRARDQQRTPCGYCRRPATRTCASCRSHLCEEHASFCRECGRSICLAHFPIPGVGVCQQCEAVIRKRRRDQLLFVLSASLIIVAVVLVRLAWRWVGGISLNDLKHWIATLAGFFVLVMCPLGLLCGYLAKTKGRSPRDGFWWGLLGGPVGVVVVTFWQVAADEESSEKEVEGFE
jgi:hypothetical protein